MVTEPAHPDVPFDEAFHDRVEPITGSWLHVLPDVRKLIRRHAKCGYDYHVGICQPAEVAVRIRWNSKYRRAGMTDIAVVYVTGSSRYLREATRDILDLYEHADAPAIMEHAVGGFYVYVAWRRP